MVETILADFARVQSDFLKIDLQTVLTFTIIALQTADLVVLID
jgi:hypothetical protein